MSNVEQWEHNEQRAMETEITTLREQVAALTKERDALRSRRCEVCGYLEHEREHTGCLREQVSKLTKERDSLVAAIDNEMVVTHMGVFNAGDDPKAALNKICCYAQDLGKFFAEDACKEQLASLAEQNKKMREALQKLACLGNGEQYGNSIGNCIAQEALSLPDLTSPVLNRIRAEGMREAINLYSPDDSAQDWIDKISARADELEKTND